MCNVIRRLTIALFICGSFAAGAQNINCAKFPISYEKLEDGTTLGILVSEAQFKRAPPWSGHGEPPLSIGRVIAIAEQWGKSKYRAYDSAGIQSVSLTEFGCPGQPKYWWYSVHFVAVKKGKPSFGGNSVAILLDGTIVEPTKVKDAF